MEGLKFDTLDPRKYIIIKGARMHNLKNIDLAIPRNKFVVITGVSGSGKSSLAFDTLYAEGQRRYVESLSAYARQFLGKIEKPAVDYIKGISPAIAIEQKVSTRNPRSTVGTSTEIYDYIKLLFARVGRTHSPVSGNEVKRNSVGDVVAYISKLPAKTKVTLLSKINIEKGKKIKQVLGLLSQQGFSRVQHNSEVKNIEDVLQSKPLEKDDFKLIIDRFAVDPEDEDNNNRISDSVQTAFYEGNGECIVEIGIEKEEAGSTKYEVGSQKLEARSGKLEVGRGKQKQETRSKSQGQKTQNSEPGTQNSRIFSNKFELDGITFEEPSVHFFSFNNPVGACKNCEGFGSVIGVDEGLVIPNKNLSVYEDAIVCWKGEKMKEWKEELIVGAHKFNFPVHRPIIELTAKEYNLLWTGNQHFNGLNRFFQFLEEQTYKIQYRVMLSRYRGKTVCPECKGTRLRKDASYVKVADRSIIELVLTPVDKLLSFFEQIQLNDHDQKIAKRLLIEITNRLKFLNDVGLGYLTLNRLSNTLSGGESQRINLATSLGSSLVGSLYILDEPSIGLHPRDTERLISVLLSLRNIGNTVIVVEHDEEIMRAADEIIDIGPLAGSNGGHLVFQGDHTMIEKEDKSLTARFLTGKDIIPVPSKRRNWKNYIEIKGARENNLKNIDIRFPLNIMTVITGVSGSGKSSLVKKVLYPAIKKIFGGFGEESGYYDNITGNINNITNVEFIDQNPIGKSSRSNPVTYVKAYDEIRGLYASMPLAKMRGYKPSHFSFNVDGGRCEVCEGDGTVTIEMQFMADIVLVCESCNGKRFKQDTLEILYEDKNIADILELTVDEAIEFFSNANANTEKRIVSKLKPLQEVGLGYVHLGQSSSTLSGGEAQRIKLASFLGQGKETHSPTLFIFDEPTTGLHFHDIQKLLYAFNALVDQGHSLIIIEHNLEVIKCADWVIDLGPEGGEKGGNVIFEGTPEGLISCKASYTGKYLAEKINKKIN